MDTSNASTSDTRNPTNKEQSSPPTTNASNTSTTKDKAKAKTKTKTKTKRTQRPLTRLPATFYPNKYDLPDVVYHGYTVPYAQFTAPRTRGGGGGGGGAGVCVFGGGEPDAYYGELCVVNVCEGEGRGKGEG